MIFTELSCRQLFGLLYDGYSKMVFIRHRIKMSMSSCRCCWLLFRQQISSRYLWYLPSYRADSYSDCFTTAIQKCVFIRHRIKTMSSCRCCWLVFRQQISSRYLWYLPSYRADSYSDCFTTAIQKWVFIRHRIKMCMSSCRCCWLDFSQEFQVAICDIYRVIVQTAIRTALRRLFKNGFLYDIE